MIMGKTRRNCGGSKKRTRKYLGGGAISLIGKKITFNLFPTDKGIYLGEPTVVDADDKRDKSNETRITKKNNEIKNKINKFMQNGNYDASDINKMYYDTVFYKAKQTFGIASNAVGKTLSNKATAFGKSIIDRFDLRKGFTQKNKPSTPP